MNFVIFALSIILISTLIVVGFWNLIFYFEKKIKERKTIKNYILNIISILLFFVTALFIFYQILLFILGVIMSIPNDFKVAINTDYYNVPESKFLGLNSFDDNEEVDAILKQHFGKNAKEMIISTKNSKETYYDYLILYPEYKKMKISDIVKYNLNPSLGYILEFKTEFINASKNVELTGVLKKVIKNTNIYYVIDNYYLNKKNETLDTYVGENIKLNIIYNTETSKDFEIYDYVIISAE